MPYDNLAKIGYKLVKGVEKLEVPNFWKKYGTRYMYFEWIKYPPHTNELGTFST
jgi:hypothetical protein